MVDCGIYPFTPPASWLWLIVSTRTSFVRHVDNGPCPGVNFFMRPANSILASVITVVVESFLLGRKIVILSLVAIYIVSLMSDLLCTDYGVTFGAYSYTTLLGPKWFDLVPLLIPLSWFTMNWAAWVIARHRAQG